MSSVVDRLGVASYHPMIIYMESFDTSLKSLTREFCEPGRPGQFCTALSPNPKGWCGQEDLNLHSVSRTSTSSWRVCQFRHGRNGHKKGYRVLLFVAKSFTANTTKFTRCHPSTNSATSAGGNSTTCGLEPEWAPEPQPAMGASVFVRPAPQAARFSVESDWSSRPYRKSPDRLCHCGSR